MLDKTCQLIYNAVMGAARKNFDDAVKLYESGLSIGDTGLAYGMSRQAMWAILRRRGVKMRPQLRYGSDNHFYRGGHQYDERVHAIVTRAIESGILVRQPCESCGASGVQADGRNKIEGHHDDYNKPLEVRWLCQSCHFKWHQENNPIRRTVELPVIPKAEASSRGGKKSWSNRKAALAQLEKARDKRQVKK